MKRKNRKEILGILLVVLLLCSCFVSEASENKGSIKITLTDGAEGTSKEGVVFGYGKVADVINDEYILLEEYEDSKVDFSCLENAEDLRVAAKELSEYGKNDGTVVTDNAGIATIRNLEVGVYLLIVADNAQYDEIAPVLVTIPTWNEVTEEMLYDIEIIPKHTPIPQIIPTDTPKKVVEVVKTGDVTKGWGYALGIAGGISLVAFCIWKKRRYSDKNVNNE